MIMCFNATLLIHSFLKQTDGGEAGDCGWDGDDGRDGGWMSVIFFGKFIFSKEMAEFT